MKSKIILLALVLWLAVSIIGCEAFVRKFTRKPKKENLPQEEMVLAPEEYKVQQLSKEELYRQTFLYWKSWQDELITALSTSTNHKKQEGCAQEALSNLTQLRGLLNEAKQKELDVYINRLKELQNAITEDAYGSNIDRNRSLAERLKMNILRNFSYTKVKENLV